jgi:hypothetical protein
MCASNHRSRPFALTKFRFNMNSPLIEYRIWLEYMRSSENLDVGPLVNITSISVFRENRFEIWRKGERLQQRILKIRKLGPLVVPRQVCAIIDFISNLLLMVKFVWRETEGSIRNREKFQQCCRRQDPQDSQDSGR